MALYRISQVAKQLKVSARTLRYYEQIGLITSAKKPGSTYREYDETAIQRLQQILALHRLRIPLRQVAQLLRGEDDSFPIQVWRETLEKIQGEIDELIPIRDTLRAFVEGSQDFASLFCPGDGENPIAVPGIQIQEEKEEETKMQTRHKDRHLADRDVRIIYLPPAVVAAYQYIGDDPETHCHQVVDDFVRKHDLVRRKPDLRHYGFNSPNPTDESGYHGYEVWVTIPEEMSVTPPLVKKTFPGGLYAAHMIPFGAFEEWEWLWEWVQSSEKYQLDCKGKGSECMYGLLEEHLNYVNHAHLENTEPEDLQLDLLCPIRVRD